MRSRRISTRLQHHKPCEEFLPSSILVSCPAIRRAAPKPVRLLPNPSPRTRPPSLHSRPRSRCILLPPSSPLQTISSAGSSHPPNRSPDRAGAVPAPPAPPRHSFPAPAERHTHSASSEPPRLKP